MPETRAEQIARWEREGWLVPGCAGCAERYAATDKMLHEVYSPCHRFSPLCESGRRPHCTCDVCW